MSEGPMARAASVEGDMEPMVRPRAELVRVWSESAPRNLMKRTTSHCEG